MAVENDNNEAGGPVGGAGNQHNDWGHSQVGEAAQSGAAAPAAQSRLDDVVGTDTGKDMPATDAAAADNAALPEVTGQHLQE
jgi:hypothetical protein